MNDLRPTPPMVLLALRVPAPLLTDAERHARALKTNRSRVLREALRLGLRSLARKGARRG